MPQFFVIDPKRFIGLIILLCLSACAGIATSLPLENLEPTQPLTQSTPTVPMEEPMTQYKCDTLNIAHRGARSLAPENTLAAARKGLEVGADMWELDVALTADGVPYLVHDDTLERTSDVAERFPERRPWKTFDFTLAEIRQLDFGSWFNKEDPFGQIAAGVVSEADQAGYAGEPAPTLEEALIFTRDHNWRVNVEIKDLSGTPGDDDAVEKVVATIEALGLVDQVLISSFNHSYLTRVKQVNPNIATGALVYRPSPKPPATLLQDLQAQAFNPREGLLQPETIRQLHEQGIMVNVYTVNDEATMRTLIEARAGGIFTDFPQILQPILNECR